MTVLGLNAILLSSSLGSDGRAMTEAAKQLRDVARDIADVVALLRQDADLIVSAARNLDSAEDARVTARFADASRSTREVSALAHAVGRQFEELAVARTASEIADRFMEAAAQLGAFSALATSLEPIAHSLEQAGQPAAFFSPETEDVLAEIRRLYTMQVERSVHDLLVPQASPTIADDPNDGIVLFA